MKKDIRKQEPIFSKVQGIHQDPPPSTPSHKPLDQNKRPILVKAAPKEDFPTRNSVDVFSPPPGDQVISRPEMKVEVVSPRVIPYPEGVDEKVNSLGMAFVQIPAGTFLMGSPEHELGRNDDEIQHEVTISHCFYLQVIPVTQAQWQALMGANPASFVQGGGELSVEGVNWQNCQEFIEKMNALGEETYRLPTEAEWEYACRAGSPTALANGDLFSLYCELDPNLDELGWYCGNSGRRPQPVAQKRPNAWGLYDMHGNVAEWCQDWYGTFPDTPRTDPQGPPSGPGRVLRGGSWFSSAKNCRSAARFHWPPQSRSQLQTLGFRLVKIT